MKRSPSAHDVARLAGVSQAAVSRAFTEGASISAETRRRVEGAARQLGYRPNLLARSLNKGSSGIIGIVIGNAQNPFCVDALDMLSKRLAEARKHVLIFTVDGDCNADVQASELIDYRVDALLLISAALSADIVRDCHAAGIPILYYSRLKHHTPEAASVTGSNRLGGRAIASHLIDRGYRRLTQMIGYSDSWTNQERERGFQEQLRGEGLEAPQTVIGHYHRAGAIAATRTLLAGADRPDAIFCASDHMACAVLEVARFEFGLEIGRELGIVGFDDIRQAAWPSFDLTTFSQPLETMTGRALEWLLADRDDKPYHHVIVPGRLIERGSTWRG